MTYLSEIEQRSRAVWDSLFTASDDAVSSVFSHMSVILPSADTPSQERTKPAHTEKDHTASANTDTQSDTQEIVQTPKQRETDVQKNTQADTSTDTQVGNRLSVYTPRQDGKADIFIHEDASTAHMVLRGIERDVSRRIADVRQSAPPAPVPEKPGIPSTERGDAALPAMRTADDDPDSAAAALWTHISRSYDMVRTAQRQTSDNTSAVSSGERSGVYHRAEDWSISFERDARRYDGDFDLL